MTTITLLFALLLAYQVKHYLCDYRFQTAYMLRKLGEDGWELPLAAHAGVHAAGSFLLGLAATLAVGRGAINVLGLALLGAWLDFAAHFFIDRLKANASRGLTPAQPLFWRHLGLDQLGHHATHYGLASLFLFA
jgi:hypothetical protein